VFNRGEMVRDFTYVDDIVEGLSESWEARRPRPAGAEITRTRDNYAPGVSSISATTAGQAHALYRGTRAVSRKKGAARPSSDAAWRRAGDFADVDELHKSVGYKPQTRSKSASSDLRSGIKPFIANRVIVILETMCVSNDTAALFRTTRRARIVRLLRSLIAVASKFVWSSV